MRDERLAAVDGLRAVAVLGVVAHHASLLPLGVGARGVDLFFVISGFCLSLPTLQRIQAGRPFSFDRQRFALSRALRIVPPYFVALALFVALAGTSFGVPSVLVPPAPFEWLQDALFLTSPAPAYNASFWTLGVEAHWYVLFPLILTLYVRSKRWFAVLGLACYGAYLATQVIVDIGTLPCFMLGIVAADLFVRGKASSRSYVVFAMLALLAAASIDRTENAGDPLWHVAAFSVFMAGIGPCARLARVRPLALAGVASYSIYLVHQPLLLWLTRYHIPWAAAAGLSVLAGFGFWLAIERPSIAAAALLRKRFSKADLAAGAAFSHREANAARV